MATFLFFFCIADTSQLLIIFCTLFSIPNGHNDTGQEKQLGSMHTIPAAAERVSSFEVIFTLTQAA